MSRKNAFGFSLVEVLLGAAMLGGIGLGVATMMKNMTKGNLKAQNESETLLSFNEMVAILSDPTNCLATFAGKSAAGDSIAQLSHKGTAKFITNTPFGNNNLKILSYSIGGYNSTLKESTLIINFEKKEMLGGGSIPKTLKLFTEVDGAGIISRCRALATYSQDLWRLNPNTSGGIIYTGSIEFGGSIAGPVLIKNTSYALTGSDNIVTGNASAGALTFTLPTAVGISGREYIIKKIDNSTNKITITPAGAEKIDGAIKSTLSNQWSYIKLVSDGANWIVIGGENNLILPPITATGGTKTTSGAYTVHTFTSSGNFIVSENGNVEYLIVGGGGGGGLDIGGGGGGGGVRTGTIAVTASTYLITIGAGGAGDASSGTGGASGGSSVFNNITANGGGGAGSNGTVTTGTGKNGGSGGGAGGVVYASYVSRSGGIGNIGAFSPVEGYSGGAGGYYTDGAGSGGGGGGGSQLGTSGSGNNGGAGGAGLSSSISGSSVIYGSGGGGGGAGGGGSCGGGPAGSTGIGGSGGGGNGGVCSSGISGVTNTGGGGGGGGSNGRPGASGGTGIVIIRYLTN